MSNTGTEQWSDIKLSDQDIDLDVAGIPVDIYDRDTIAQDIQSMLYDSGLVIELIGQRNEELWQLKQQQMIDNIENDERIIPGTVVISRSDYQTMYLQADTEQGPISTVIDITAAQGVGS